MRSNYTKKLPRCKINNSFRKQEKVLPGVPQDSVKGPLLFKIFINNIFYFFKSVAQQTTLITIPCMHLIQTFHIS